MEGTIKTTLYISGLHCADCAGKIEREVNRLAGVTNANLDFISQKLVIEVEDKGMLQNIEKQARETALSIEPGIKIALKPKEAPGHDGHVHTHEYGESGTVKKVVFGLGAVLFGSAFFLQESSQLRFLMFLISYLLIGGEVLLRALRNMTKGKIFDENFLMSIATVGAFAIGEYPEGVAVMFFYQVGEFFQDRAVNRSRKSIAALMDIRPDYANLKVGRDIKKVAPEEVKTGQQIVVKPGEKIPLDGKVMEGRSTLDISALTGESLPKDVEPGSEVLSGSINKNGMLVIETTKEFAESTLAKILDLVQNASSKKAPMEKFITKFARYYTPAVVFSALALAVIPPLIIPGALFSEWLRRALVFLVVSCPCALVISIPLGFFGGIGAASQKGILIKGSNYLEALNNVDTVVFDKTGTLTRGVFEVVEIVGKGVVDDEELLLHAANAESYSNHPIALSILRAYGKEIDQNEIEGYEEISGHGIKVKSKGKTVLAGNMKLMEREGIVFEETFAGGTLVHLAIDGDYAGFILIADEVRADSKEAIRNLKKSGTRQVVMLTGDSKAVGERVAADVGVDKVYAELLPHQKVEKLEMLDERKAKNGNLVAVGDGINDAPILARADIGVAMGGLGSDAAIEAADVVLMTDEPSKLVTAINIAKGTHKIVWQNIVFALGVKGIILILGATGYATMWEAVFGDVGVSLIAVLNSMRVMKMKA